MCYIIIKEREVEWTPRTQTLTLPFFRHSGTCAICTKGEPKFCAICLLTYPCLWSIMSITKERRFPLCTMFIFQSKICGRAKLLAPKSCPTIHYGPRAAGRVKLSAAPTSLTLMSSIWKRASGCSPSPRMATSAGTLRAKALSARVPEQLAAANCKLKKV